MCYAASWALSEGSCLIELQLLQLLQLLVVCRDGY
jgi:hypothetical protein